MAIAGISTLPRPMQPGDAAAASSFDDLDDMQQGFMVASAIVVPLFTGLVGAGIGAMLGDANFGRAGFSGALGALVGAGIGGALTLNGWQGSIDDMARANRNP